MNWNIFLLQVNLLLVVFYGFYWLLLRKETYSVNNRVFLLFSGVLSLILPLWNSELMQSWTVTQQVSRVIYDTSLYQASPSIPGTGPSEDYTGLLLFFYVSGFTFFLLKFIVDLFKVHSHARQPAVGAFSFFNKIMVNEDLEKNEIISEHESVHARQGHSFDVIFFELLGIVCWFNPVIWCYKIAIRNIHEFIADEIASEYMASKADYALLLLSQQFRVASIPMISTFFSYKNLKLRIQMLKKERSGRVALVKYALVLPLFAAATIMISALIINKKKTEQLYELAVLSAAQQENPVENAAPGSEEEPGEEEKAVYIELQTVTTWKAYSIFSQGMD